MRNPWDISVMEKYFMKRALFLACERKLKIQPSTTEFLRYDYIYFSKKSQYVDTWGPLLIKFIY